MTQRESVGTLDGIAPSDWDAIEELGASLYNALDTPDEQECRNELRALLRALDDKYGRRPSLLAARADFMEGTSPERERLYEEAYDLALGLHDPFNLLYVAHSMCELCLESEAPAATRSIWLRRLGVHLESLPDELIQADYQRFLRMWEP